LVLRSSSLAHLARASWTAGSSRSRTLLRSVTAVPWLPSLVEGAGVDHWLRGLLAAQGATFALVKATVDRGAAEGTRRLTEIWPGDEGQQPDESV
jgi:hypothetical protein